MEFEPRVVLDVRGMACPMPLLKTKLQLNGLASGAFLEVLASDAGSARDIPAFLRLTTHVLHVCETFDAGDGSDGYRFIIECVK